MNILELIAAIEGFAVAIDQSQYKTLRQEYMLGVTSTLREKVTKLIEEHAKLPSDKQNTGIPE